MRVSVSEWARVLRRMVTDIVAGSVTLDDDGVFVRAKVLLRG